MRNGGEDEVRRTTTVHHFAQREIDDSNEIINHKGRETEEKKQANETRRNKKIARRENFVEKIAREFFSEETYIDIRPQFIRSVQKTHYFSTKFS